jgi:hypothetical protein
MNFAPKSEKELKDALVIPEGEYDYEVIDAEEKTSKKGNEMIEITLKVFHGDSFRTITDYLMEAMAFKLRHFCEAGGIIKLYDNGTLTASDCIGCSGKLKLTIEKDTSGKYSDKNTVKDYIVTGEVTEKKVTPKAEKSADPVDDDDIQF